MADFVFNIAKGRIRQLILGGGTLKALVLKTSDTDAALKDLTTVAAILAATNVEANFTNYARPTLGSLTAPADNATDTVLADCADISFASAGGATNNTTTDIIIYYDPGGGDSNCVPLVCLDCVFTTNGQNVSLTIPTNGFWGAS